ncbi:MAG: peptide chain release factor 2 [Gammaproteobacteria bacterium AqS3]|nr:peptide chain release factor 2 [Gammaproteobacteria bacterium AqS3]
MELSAVKTQLGDLLRRAEALRGVFDCDSKRERLKALELEQSADGFWDDPERARLLAREQSHLARTVAAVDAIEAALSDCAELIGAGLEEELLGEVAIELSAVEKPLAEMEFELMFSGEADPNDAFLSVQSGAGGTEAQDWAEMLLRMYTLWIERRGFACTLISQTQGEVAGIKSATLRVAGDYAYGWLRTEGGVHRLVRKSPFDSGNRRHTSFASVEVSPEVDERIEIEINPADLRVDTFRAQGAGGQHVNTTDSAVRITHQPSGIVVQCQNERSQHQNREAAMRQLRSRLYELELQRRRAEAEAAKADQAEIGWGQQIRSYVLDKSYIKDLRTGVEVGNTQAVLDGDLDAFVEASLKQGV